MTDTWRERLEAGHALVLDGGTGSELRRRGYALHPHAWSAPASLSHFEVLRQIHADYIDAGADVITTNTFAATRFVLDAAALGNRSAEIARRAVAAAREARDASGRDIAIAGSISCLPPRFDPSAYPDARAELAAYRELAELLATEGVDLIALEMLEDSEHAARACEAALATGLPVWLGVSCRMRDDGELGAFDFPNTRFVEVLDALLPFAPDAVNVMHSPPDAITPALLAVGARWRGVRGAYPELEAGAIGVVAGGRARATRNVAGQANGATHSPTGLAELARGWLAAGARVVGGCCGATPAHVSALRAALDSLGTAGR
jgi:homocysteine S-methyltransferase